MIRLLFAAAVAASLGCSSTATTSGTSDSGSSQPEAGIDAGADAASADGGFDFTFTNGGANITRADFKVTPVNGSFCMGTAATRQCSFTAAITDSTSGCTGILNAAFVGPLTAGTSFPIVADPTTPIGKGELSYTESCGGTSRLWKATGGTLTLDAVTLPPQGLTTGTASFSVDGATLAPAPFGAGDAQGGFTAAGKGTSVSFSAP